MAETAQLIPNVLNSTEMFDKTFHIRLDNMTQINIGGTWHPLTDVSHVKRGTGCVVNLKQLSMYFRVHWKKVQFKYALALIIIILTKTARTIFSILTLLLRGGHIVNEISLYIRLFGGQDPPNSLTFPKYV